MPLNFVKSSKLVLLRLEAATELHSLLEVKLRSRFIVLIVGPIEKQIQLYEVGRAMASCMADDVKGYFFLANFEIIFKDIN